MGWGMAAIQMGLLDWNDSKPSIDAGGESSFYEKRTSREQEEGVVGFVVSTSSEWFV